VFTGFGAGAQVVTVPALAPGTWAAVRGSGRERESMRAPGLYRREALKRSAFELSCPARCHDNRDNDIIDMTLYDCIDTMTLSCRLMVTMISAKCALTRIIVNAVVMLSVIQCHDIVQ